MIFCVYPLFVAAVGVVFFVVIFAAGVVVATTSASAAILAVSSAFVVAAVSFITLSYGQSFDSIAEGGERLRCFLQLEFIGGVHLRERQGVLVIFLLDGSGDICRYYALLLVSPLYCGVHTTEKILDRLCVACEPEHLVHIIFFLIEEYDCVGVRLVRRRRVVTFNRHLISECAAAI